MARTLNRLSAKAYETITKSDLIKPAKYSDGGGLSLVVGGGRCRWILRVTTRGKTREIGLGSGRSTKLADARNKAKAMREAIARGDDVASPIPSAPAVVRTFGDEAEAYIASRETLWRNEKHRAQWRMTIDRYAHPLLLMPVEAVTTTDILKVLEPIWHRTPETASRVRGRIEAILLLQRHVGIAPAPIPRNGATIWISCSQSAIYCLVGITPHYRLKNCQRSCRPCVA